MRFYKSHCNREVKKKKKPFLKCSQVYSYISTRIQCEYWLVLNSRVLYRIAEKGPTENTQQQDTASGRWRQAEQSAMASRERWRTCPIMLTTDTSVEQQQQRNTNDTVVVLFIFSSPGVILEHSSICETSRPCNSCCSTVTPNCRYVVFPSVTDCLVVCRCAGHMRPSCGPISNSNTLANPQKPTIQKVIWNKKLVM